MFILFVIKQLLDNVKAVVHGYFEIIILKLTGAFEIHVHFEMILKRELMFLNYTFNLRGTQRNYKIFCFQIFSKDRDVFRTQSNI